MIDLVLSFVDNTDPAWQAEYLFWKNQENADDINHAPRLRNWDNLQYVFRSIELNMPWVDRIFFVLSSPTQIPLWLNTKHPKLQIVFHKDFVPSAFLPTFNGCLISMFLHRIPGLSETYILTDDDIFFTAPLPKDFFFENGVPVSFCRITGRAPIRCRNVHDYTENNNFNLLADLTGSYIRYLHPHIASAHLVSVEKYIVDTHYERIIKPFLLSKFRHKENYTNLLFDHWLRRFGHVIPKNIAANSRVFQFSDTTQIGLIKSHTQMVCFNDTEWLTVNFEEKKENVKQWLSNKFLLKSSFEI